MSVKKQSKKSLLIYETNQIISEYTTKLTIRQIYYRLVSKHVIKNLQNEYKYLVKSLVDARWKGEVKFTGIEDRTRRFLGGDSELSNPEQTFNSWLDAFKKCDQYHQLPMWLNQECYVEAWIEKQALQGIFEEITDQWNVTLFPCRGYPSLTKLYEAYVRINGESHDKKAIILYFGDHDPSGEDIPRKIEEDLVRLGLDVEICKVAITSEQIKAYSIPPLPAKTSDPRYAKFVATHGDEAVELDAIDPDILQGLIRDAISGNFDDSIRDSMLKREAKEKAKVRKMLQNVLGSK